MTKIADIALQNSKLSKLVGNQIQNHVGYIIRLNYNEANLLTNDNWKEQNNGIPNNSILIAANFNHAEFSKSKRIHHEIIILRVISTFQLPQDSERIATIISHYENLTSPLKGDELDGYDKITFNDLQFGGIRCRILGTLYTNHDGQLKLGSDIENYFSCSSMRVYKPDPESLKIIVNHLDTDKISKNREECIKAGFKNIPEPFDIGTIRYTSTDRLHRASEADHVHFGIQPIDFLSKRTAIFGMTRTGKSNTVKSLISTVKIAADKDSEAKIGQLIFDINGEYANATHQDDGSSIGEVFQKDTVRYRAIQTTGFENLLIDFYINPMESLFLLNQLSKDDPYRDQGDLSTFLEDSLEEPDPTDRSTHNRWNKRVCIFKCILNAADFPSQPNTFIKFTANDQIRTLIEQALNLSQGEVLNPSAGRGLTLDEATNWFITARKANLIIKRAYDASVGPNPQGQPFTIGIQNPVPINELKSSATDRGYFDSTMLAYLNVLARKNDHNNEFRGWKLIAKFLEYHAPGRTIDVADEIYNHLVAGRIVILDLSVGPERVRNVIPKRIARRIFDKSMETLISGNVPPNIILYVEEAHNIIGQKEELTETWPRIAKEGAKARIALVYATQEPSSIHSNILSNTENWFVTHLNNDEELNKLCKYYDFEDFKYSIKVAQDVGFARVKTLSSPFTISLQITKFEPAKIIEFYKTNNISLS